jgi:hypothetical protein
MTADRNAESQFERKLCEQTHSSVKGFRDMGVCGNYTKHHWTRASHYTDKVCMSCGLPFAYRGGALLESPPQPLVIRLSNAKTSTISPLNQIGAKGSLGAQ